MTQPLPDPGTSITVGQVEWRVAPGDAAFLDQVGNLRFDRLRAVPGMEVVKQSPSRFWGRLRAPNGDYFVKGRKLDRGKRRFETLLRPSAMREEWRKSWWLVERGIETPVPAAVGEVRRFGMARETFFACHWLEGAQPLSTFLDEESRRLEPAGFERSRRRVVLLLGRLLGSLHTRGAYHGELHELNVLVAKDAAGSPRVLPIDLDHLVIPARFTELDRAWNLHQITWYLRKSIARWRPGPRDFVRFIKGYHEAAPESARSWQDLFRTLRESLPVGPHAKRPRRRTFRLRS